MKLKIVLILIVFFVSVVCPKSAWAYAGGPSGIYALDSSQGANRDANIRNYSFVTGYVWRMSWADFELSKDNYNFSKIDDIISRLQPINKKLSIILGGADSLEPGYITSLPPDSGFSSVVTWSDPNAGIRAVPWDSWLLYRFNKFTQALASHQVGGISLCNHPILANINLGIAGLGEIRERPGVEISNFSGYTRTNFINAVKSSLHAQTDQFPSKFVYVGFWKVTDANSSPELWEETRTNILNEFNGINYPRVGFWMENLAASANTANLSDPLRVVTATPTTDYASALYLSKNSTFIMFQALASWLGAGSDPLNQHYTKLVNGVPSDGIQYAYNTFESKYFELYVPDLDNPSYQPSFQYWHNSFIPPAAPTGLMVT